MSTVTKRRAVITGAGAVTPLGTSIDATRERLRRGDSAIARVRRFDARACAADRAAEIDGFDARPFFRAPKALKITDERTRYAVAAASMALDDARLDAGTFDADRAGVIIGSSGSDLQAEDLGRALRGVDAEDLAAFGERILSGLNPLWLLVNLPNMVSAHVSIQFELRGPNSTVMTDWIAGAQAIGEAASWIAADEADVVLAGGADCGVLPFVFANYEQAGLFDSPDLTLADGAALFVVEEREHARARGARVYAEVTGFGASAAPHAAELAMRDALAQAEWTPHAATALLSACVPHPTFRQVESDAMHAVFGDRQPRALPSPRASIGFALAAAAPIDLALQLTSSDGEPMNLIANALGLDGQAASLCFALEARS